MANAGIKSRWSELRGEKQWNGLLNHPLTDDDLRRYIIHYGQMVGSIRDVHKYNEHGELLKSEFFEKACLTKGNTLPYEVREYLIADNVVFGFVAVTTESAKKEFGRRDILITWRGTIGWKEWYENIKRSLVPAREFFHLLKDNDAKVHTGFVKGYTKVRVQVSDALSNLLYQYRDEDISITVAGFSRGGALATLNAMDIVDNKMNIRTDKKGRNIACHVTAFTFGSPRVGNNGLKEAFDRLEKEHDLHLLRIRNTDDIVTYLPVLPDYVDVGTELSISSDKSTYLKNNNSSRGYVDQPPSQTDEKKFIESVDNDDSSRGMVGEKFSNHYLDVYLHLLALKEGEKGELVDPNFALVNKYLGILQNDEKQYQIPENWWDGKDKKGMVQEKDGHWEVKPGHSSKDLGSNQACTKRALLVGCNYPRTKYRLRGCINDVNLMKELIQGHFGFEEDNVKVLIDDGTTDDWPTRENILTKLKDMVDATKPDDVLFLHFSGHGTLIEHIDNDNGKVFVDGQAIVASDINLITDKDLKDLIRDIEEHTNFTILSDSCHSGDLIGQDKEQFLGPVVLKRDGSLQNDQDRDCQERFIPLSILVPSLISLAGTANDVVTSTTGTSIMGHLGNALTYVFGKKDISIQFKPDELAKFYSRSIKMVEGILLSGCESKELSADVWGSGIEPHGAFTNAVVEVLKDQKNMTNIELMKKVRSKLKEQGFTQHPCLHCADNMANKPFLGGSVTD